MDEAYSLMMRRSIAPEASNGVRALTTVPERGEGVVAGAAVAVAEAEEEEG